ncbi:hypothetical protein GCM10022381_32290 [Leifsonia kafniensis]|uniref:Uncharacterized protein n=1 Tax=Leifsonia kafniensis TaxID=475957 RepID=A0ABP7KX31_9MICO
MNAPSTFDTESLNAALGRAVENTDLEGFAPVGATRTRTLTLLRATSNAINEGSPQVAETIIRKINPEPTTGEPSVAHMIGVSLGLLDLWHDDPDLTQTLARARAPRWASRSRAAGTDIISLASKGRAFDSIGSLHRRYNAGEILNGSILAVTGTLQIWAESTNQSVRGLGKTVLTQAT